MPLRFDCLSAPSDPCCSRSKRQIEAYEAPAFKGFEEEKLPTVVQLFEEEEEASSLQSLHQLPLRSPQPFISTLQFFSQTLYEVLSSFHGILFDPRKWLLGSIVLKGIMGRSLAGANTIRFGGVYSTYSIASLPI